MLFVDFTFDFSFYFLLINHLCMFILWLVFHALKLMWNQQQTNKNLSNVDLYNNELDGKVVDFRVDKRVCFHRIAHDDAFVVRSLLKAL